MTGRPNLATFPRALDVARWYVPDPDFPLSALTGMPLRFAIRTQRIVRWACVCGAEGRMWDGEPPLRKRLTPGTMELEPRRRRRFPPVAPSRFGDFGCPECGAAWER